MNAAITTRTARLTRAAKPTGFSTLLSCQISDPFTFYKYKERKHPAFPKPAKTLLGHLNPFSTAIQLSEIKNIHSLKWIPSNRSAQTKIILLQSKRISSNKTKSHPSKLNLQELDSIKSPSRIVSTKAKFISDYESIIIRIPNFNHLRLFYNRKRNYRQQIRWIYCQRCT